MSPKTLPQAYLKKTTSRLKALRVLLEDANYSDVVREAQEIVELVSKAVLRLGNFDPPQQHDVSQELEGIKDKFSTLNAGEMEDLIFANRWLRREREMSFYGAEDFDPTEGYDKTDADKAFALAEKAVRLLALLLPPHP